jgi:antitoxin component YwqK of YwqJK toxin-antitoxin module
MGEDAYTEWGSFDHGIRTGVWYRFDSEGEVASIERYRLGMLDGEAKYFERGRLVSVGHYRGLNPGYAFDTIYVVDPVTDVEYKRVISTDRGTVKHGLWQYYDQETGRLVRELDYQIDEVVARKDFTIAAIDSAWYKRREAAMPHNQKRYYKPPRDKQVHYTDFK